MAYILEHSGSRLLLIDHEYTHLIDGMNIPFIVCNDTGRVGDPYEIFLTNGRKFSQEKGWPGLVPESDENAPCVLCYTCVASSESYSLLSTSRTDPELQGGYA